MSHPSDPYSEDNLGHLIRTALKALVSGKEPPKRVWRRIKRALKNGKWLPRRFRIPWLSLTIQPILTLLLLTLGGIGLGTLLNLEGVCDSPGAPSPPVTRIQPQERPPAWSDVAISEERDLYLLKMRSRHATRPGAGSEEQVHQISAFQNDVIESEPLPPLYAVQERKLMYPGP